jgi:hypothetical protein
MIKNYAETLKGIPLSRRKGIISLRRVLKKNKPKEVKESLEGSQLVYTLPLRYFSESYNKRPLLYATLTDRKSYISLNLICIHNDRKYRDLFAKKILKTKACIGATGCCYKIKSVNDELIYLLEKELTKYNLRKFTGTFKKYRQKKINLSLVSVRKFVSSQFALLLAND